jgi:hypothetical protein
VESVVEAARAQTVSDLSKFSDGRPQLGHRTVDQVVEADGSVVEVSLRHQERHAKGDEALLAAVMQVAFYPPSLVVSGLEKLARLAPSSRKAAVRSSRTPHQFDERRGRGGHVAEQLSGEIASWAAILRWSCLR